MRRGRVDWRGSRWETWCADLPKLQNRVFARHVCPPRHEQRPLHSRHLLRSSVFRVGCLLLGCNGVYQHKLHISLKHVRTSSCTEWREALALSSPIGRAVLSAPQAVVNGASFDMGMDYLAHMPFFGALKACSCVFRVLIMIYIVVVSASFLIIVAGGFLIFFFCRMRTWIFLKCPPHLLPCAAHIMCHMQSHVMLRMHFVRMTGNKSCGSLGILRHALQCVGVFLAKY